MKWRWRILILAAACAAVVIVAAIVWPREREPEYKGRTLSEWIQGGASRAPQRPGTAPVIVWADEAKRIEAVQHIGTNALPYLLKWIEASDFPRPLGKLDTIAIKVLNKGAARSWLQYRSRKFYRAIDACRGFDLLGTNAAPAVPQLVRLSHSTNHWVAQLASSALNSIDGKLILPYRDYVPGVGWSIQANWTNSVQDRGAAVPEKFAVGHVWRTNSKVRVPAEIQAPSTNIQAPVNLQAPTTNSH